MRLLAFLLLSILPVCAETMNRIHPQSPPWQRITRDSGMVFSGVVTQVQRSAGATRITLRVESAIRGVRRGQILTIREWSGLWENGERYIVGERVLLFLYPRSKLGLTSPVGGRLGRYPLDAAGRVLIGNPQIPSPRPVPLRTVRAQIMKSVKE